MAAEMTPPTQKKPAGAKEVHMVWLTAGTARRYGVRNQHERQVAEPDICPSGCARAADGHHRPCRQRRRTVPGSRRILLCGPLFQHSPNPGSPGDVVSYRLGPGPRGAGSRGCDLSVIGLGAPRSRCATPRLLRGIRANPRPQEKLTPFVVTAGAKGFSLRSRNLDLRVND
jgi:hypothetical protein